MAAQQSPWIYSDAILRLYRLGPHRTMTLPQFAQQFQAINRDNAHMVYRPFVVPMYTAPHYGRPRQVVINPNYRRAVSRFLWDTRRCMGNLWDAACTRANIFINGVKADVASVMPSLRVAAPYSVRVVPADDGLFEIPIDDPIAEELEQQRAVARTRRAQLESLALAKQPVVATTTPETTPVMIVRDAIANSFADKMTDLCVRVNQAHSGNSQFALVVSPQATRAAATEAIRQNKVYEQLGFANCDDFFRRHLKVKSTVGLVNDISSDITGHMRKLPKSVARYDRNGVHAKYRAMAVSGPLMTQWGETVKNWFTKAPSSRPTTATYHVRNDYQLAVTGSHNDRPVPAPMKFNKKRHDHSYPAARVETPFEPFAFASRTEKTSDYIQRAQRDAQLVRSALSPDLRIQAVAPVDQVPRIRVPGASLVSASLGSSMPAAEPINSSMPAAEPIERVAQSINSSMPAAEPINSSMPAAEPITRVAQPIKSSMAAAEPFNPDEELIDEPAPAAKSGGLSMPAAEPINCHMTFSSMPNVGLKADMVSVSDDPLAAELAHEVIGSTDYSGVIVPDMSVMSVEVRREVAANIHDNLNRKRMVEAYQLRRADTSRTLNDLLNGGREEETPVLAANNKAWRMQASHDGALLIRTASGELLRAEVRRIKERPEAVIIYAPVSSKMGQF